MYPHRQVIDGDFISGLCNTLAAHITDCCNLVLGSILCYEANFSPQGRQEVRTALDWLKKASALQDIVPSVNIANAYKDWAEKVKSSEQKEQEMESERVMRRFDQAMDDFTAKLFSVVSLIHVNMYMRVHLDT